MLKTFTIVKATNSTSVYQNLVEVKCNRSDTSSYVRPPWSSPPDNQEGKTMEVNDIRMYNFS